MLKQALLAIVTTAALVAAETKTPAVVDTAPVADKSTKVASAEAAGAGAGAPSGASDATSTPVAPVAPVADTAPATGTKKK